MTSKLDLSEVDKAREQIGKKDIGVIAQEIEEVVVSATKKEQSVQDIPVSIEAFTAEDIDKNLVEDFSDLAEVVPGLIVDKALGSGSAYSMIGVGSYGVGAAVVKCLGLTFL